MGSSGGATAKTSLAKRYRKPTDTIGLGMIDPSQRNNILSMITLDPNQFKNIGTQFGNYAFGSTNPLNDPNTQATLDAMWAKSQQGINQNIANLQGSYARQGLVSPAMSSRLQQMQNQMTTRGMENYQAQVLPQMLQLGEAAKSRQLASLDALGKYNLMPYEIFSQAASKFTKSGQSGGSSPFAFLGK